ncbi:MAG: CooT family nickel-binding protein [Lachnospiraceae bacterium]|nr:CooT family nickel-binding protein [Lachnospiraceae bacterium]
MCLSTAYQNVVSADAILMKNVMSLEVKPDRVILKDLMERTLSVPGSLKEVNLVDGIVVLEPVAGASKTVGRAQ